MTPATSPLRDTPLSVASGTGVLQNDTLGSPAATVLSFGGGALPGTAASNAAGTTASFGTGGALKLNADGSFDFTPSAGFTGSFSFGYRIGNPFGTSDAVATISRAADPGDHQRRRDDVYGRRDRELQRHSNRLSQRPRSRRPAATALPSGVTFVDNGDGTGHAQRHAGVGSGGSYQPEPSAPPIWPERALRKASRSRFSKGRRSPAPHGASFTARRCRGSSPSRPAASQPRRSALAGALPTGVTFVDNGDGTGTLSGTPAAQAAAIPLMFSADNSAGAFAAAELHAGGRPGAGDHQRRRRRTSRPACLARSASPPPATRRLRSRRAALRCRWA